MTARSRACRELPADPFLADEVPPVGPNIAEATEPAPKLVNAEELVLGASDVADSKNPYLLRLQLTQDDASVFRATSSRYDAEFDRAIANKKPGRLVLIQDNPKAPSRSRVDGDLHHARRQA